MSSRADLLREVTRNCVSGAGVWSYTLFPNEGASIFDFLSLTSARDVWRAIIESWKHIKASQVQAGSNGINIIVENKMVTWEHLHIWLSSVAPLVLPLKLLQQSVCVASDMSVIFRGERTWCVQWSPFKWHSCLYLCALLSTPLQGNICLKFQRVFQPFLTPEQNDLRPQSKQSPKMLLQAQLCSVSKVKQPEVCF